MMQTLSAIDSLRKKVMLENNLISYNANSQAIAILLLDSCSYSEMSTLQRKNVNLGRCHGSLSITFVHLLHVECFQIMAGKQTM